MGSGRGEGLRFSSLRGSCESRLARPQRGAVVMAANDWSAVFLLTFVAMIIGSCWGAAVLARKWTKKIGPQILLTLVLFGVFFVAGTTAIIAGCVAVSGPDFH